MAVSHYEQVVGIFANVWLDNIDVSADVGPCLLSLEYSDDLDGKTGDKLTVKLEDSQGLFQGKFYPKKGSALRFEFGFDKPGGERIAFSSEKGFEMDSVEIQGPPDAVTWKASGQKPAGAIHTKKSKAWEKTTLGGIAGAIAGAHGLLSVYRGQSPYFEYISQTHESDYEFVKRLAHQYGLAASLKGSKGGLTLVIADPRQPVGGLQFEVKRESVTNFSFKDEAIRGKGGAQTTHYDSSNKKLVQVGGAGGSGGHVERTVSVQQAPSEHIQGTSNDAKKDEATNSLTLPGNPKLLAGALVSLAGWGRNDGEWIIIRSKHTLDVASGYKTNIALRRPK